MARSRATFTLDYFDDPDVIGLSADADRVYLRLVISPMLSQAGTGPWQPKQLLRQLPQFDEDRLLSAIDELEAARFAFVDIDTEELFVRPLMRRDGIVAQPNVLASACGFANLVRSPRLRPIVGEELSRIWSERYATPPAEGKLPRGEVAYRTAYQALEKAVLALGGTRPLNPSSTPLVKGSGTPLVNPSPIPPVNPLAGVTDTTAKPFTDTPTKGFTEKGCPRTPSGSGSGSGNRFKTEGGYGGGVTREPIRSATGASSTDPTDPPPGNLDPDNPRCPRHADIAADERGPNCRDCAKVRQWCDAAPDRAALERQRAAAERRTAIADCPACDEGGWALDDDGIPVEPAQRCEHLAASAVRHG